MTFQSPHRMFCLHQLSSISLRYKLNMNWSKLTSNIQNVGVSMVNVEVTARTRKFYSPTNSISYKEKCTVFVSIFFTFSLARKPNLETFSIYSNKFFHNFHLSESSFIIFTCPNTVLLVPFFVQVGQREDWVQMEHSRSRTL